MLRLQFPRAIPRRPWPARKWQPRFSSSSITTTTPPPSEAAPGEASSHDAPPEPSTTTPAATANDQYIADLTTRLRREMVSRPAHRIPDRMSPTPAYLLNLALHDHLPPFAAAPAPPFAAFRNRRLLTQGSHLVYFPPHLTDSQLLPDGTDPAHSPGAPFSRRMWAGGRIDFADPAHALTFACQPAICSESVRDVSVRGREGDEKVFVELRREYRVSTVPGGAAGAPDAFPSALTESRTLVFMREPDVAAVDGDSPPPPPPRRVVKAPHEPTYSVTLTPSPRLLFQFSALTYNAHAIHLDLQHCREREGHRGLLVHGPLSLVLMLRVLHLAAAAMPGVRTDVPAPTAASIEYRNLAPLYAGEPMRVCVRPRPNDDTTPEPGSAATKMTLWDVWIEGPDGGLAVKGTATMLGGQAVNMSILRYNTNLRQRIDELVAKEKAKNEEVSAKDDEVSATGEEVSAGKEEVSVKEEKVSTKTLESSAREELPVQEEQTPLNVSNEIVSGELTPEDEEWVRKVLDKHASKEGEDELDPEDKEWLRNVLDRSASKR